MRAPAQTTLAPPAGGVRRWVDYSFALFELTKPRLSMLVILTAGCGLVLGEGFQWEWRYGVMLLATALLVGAANALNSYLEHDVDSRMLRTRMRPLPSGRITRAAALAFGVGLGAVTIPLLYLSANALTAVLGAAAFVTYVLIYTPMKRFSSWALLVGAFPGAVPPLMGWTAVTGRIDDMGLYLFLFLVAWQLPHFLAISFYLREDYARGGLSVFSIRYGNEATRLAIISSSAVLVALSFAPVIAGSVEGWLYPTVAALCGLMLLSLSLASSNTDSGRWARRVFASSIIYLTGVLTALVAA